MSSPRTSISDPLRVDFVTTHTPGRLGMTFAPGKTQPNAMEGTWRRDLAVDLRRLRAVYRADVLVSVIEAEELHALGIDGLAAELGALGIRWLHVPVRDVDVPDDDRAWLRAVRVVRACLADGQTVVVHCKGGLGRTGTFAASVVATYGTAPAESIAMVRAARADTIETRRQEDFVTEVYGAWRASETARVVGCLVAGAVGDALGAPVEFDSLAKIRSAHGQAGVRDYVAAYGRVGAITDDTQMTLFTAEGLLRAHTRGVHRGICHPPSMVEYAYFRWLWTQGDAVPEALASFAAGWLFGEARLHATRAPGNTCLNALRLRVRARVDGTPLPEPLNDSKGCGGVMRVAPVGLVAQDPWSLAADCAALTHAHPAGYDSAAVFAEIIAEVMTGWGLASAVDRVWSRRRAECHPDTRAAVDRALALVAQGAPATAERLETLGGGWVGEEALAIALYCALAAPDFESALTLAVTHSGDSDSTGALTGNLLGADLGAAAIPARWLEGLELRDVIERIAGALASMRLDGVVDDVAYPG
jgi:ADP-ribosylglycohydrolase/protein-tyrosine phosphatase